MFVLSHTQSIIKNICRRGNWITALSLMFSFLLCIHSVCVLVPFWTSVPSLYQNFVFVPHKQALSIGVCAVGRQAGKHLTHAMVLYQYSETWHTARHLMRILSSLSTTDYDDNEFFVISKLSSGNQYVTFNDELYDRFATVLVNHAC